jgi:TolB-like protein/Tfp pilus assembly protein PilF
LERIVSKALRKDKRQRYQVVQDLELDLKTLKHRLEFEAELERARVTDGRDEHATLLLPTGGTARGPEQIALTLVDNETTDVRTPSRARRSMADITRNKAWALLFLPLLVIATIAAYFTYSRYRAGSGPSAITSIAVLPFVNASNDAENEYLSDGISESIINRLSQLSGVKVIANSSSIKYKGKEADPREVASALGVTGILTGRLTQHSDNILISAELIDVRDRTQVWGEQYNRKSSDLLQVQTEISSEIANKLRLRLTAGERQQVAKRETVNPQAYELLLKGRSQRFKGTEGKKKAAEYFNQAIAVDPNYALAYAELADAYRSLAGTSALDPNEYLPKAEAAAQKALELDESLPEAHYALANLKSYTWAWADAEREYKRAIELNPNLALARHFYAYFLSYVGRHDQAIAEIERARELDPLSPRVNATVGQLLYYARQYDQSIETLKKTLELDQNNTFTHFFLANTFAAKGMHTEAITAYQETFKLGFGTPTAQIYLGAEYARAGRREQAEAILKQLQTSKEYVSPGELAILYTALGEQEQAFSSLEKAYAARDLQLQYLRVSPAYDPLRSDPRFQDLLRRVGLAS